MRIGIVTLAVYPDSKDGSAKYIRGLFDALKARGHEVKLFAAKWGEGADDPDIHFVEVPQSRIYWVPKYMKGIKKLLKSEQFDIIQANGSRGAIPVISAKKPYIGLIHDVGPFETEFTKIPVVRWLEKLNAKKAQKIITNSQITKEGIIHYMKGDPEKIKVVYCGYDSFLKPEPEEGKKLRERYGISPDAKLIYYVGRVAEYKGIDQIIQAFYEARKKIPNLTLVVGGKPTFKMKEKYQQWIQQFPEVKFIGMVPDEQMAAHYSMADVFCTYSFASEGFGITPIEAIACGLPVICSDLPAYKEILQDNAIFVEKNRPDLLTKAFIEYFNNSSLKQRIMKNAADHIKKYTWENVAELVEKVYIDYLESQKSL